MAMEKMLADENPNSSIKAFNVFYADLVENLLAKADMPHEASAYIAEELRALVGARTVLVFQNHPESSDYKLVSVYPLRRKEIANTIGINYLLISANLKRESQIISASDDSEESRALHELGSESAIIVPLAFSSRYVGSLILLDLLDTSTTAQIIAPLERLSSIFALVLRNGELYTNLQQEVATRTRLLVARSRDLENSLREKEILLKEVHHRVKNNLQIVISLLHMKAVGAADPEVRKILEESQSRIYSLALIHEEMYRTDNFALIDIGEYLEIIADRILETCALDVEKTFDLSPLYLELDTAVPCGLIVSELIMNAAKHVFSKQPHSRLRIATKNIDNTALIEIADNGPGLPDNYMETSKGSIGMTIVEGLTDQIHATLEISNEEGACFRLRFPLPKRDPAQS